MADPKFVLLLTYSWIPFPRLRHLGLSSSDIVLAIEIIALHLSYNALSNNARVDFAH